LHLTRFISYRISKGEPGSFSASIHKVAVTSISVGILALIIAFCVLGGFQDKIKEKVYAFSGHLLVTKYTLSTSFEDSEISFNEELRSTLEHTSYVKKWQSYAYKAGLLKTKEEVQGVIFKGVSNDFDTTYFKQHMIRGNFPDLTSKEYTTDVAISQYLSNYLKLDIGDDVLIYFVQNPPRYRKLQIVGVYETGLEEFDQKLLLGDLDLVRRINNWDSTTVSGVEVFVEDGVDSYAAQEELFKNIAADLYVENTKDKYLQIFDWLSLLNRNVVVFLFLILIVASFSMVSVLLILIMERTQMVGMLKAMGAENGLIRSVFVFLGWRLMFKGLLIGNGVGLAIVWLQYKFKVLPLDPVNYYMSYVPISFDWYWILGINILFAGLIAASLLIPVTIVSRIRPIQAIRFD
jgi:lipoprotein-releasing system permease protein